MREPQIEPLNVLTKRLKCVANYHSYKNREIIERGNAPNKISKNTVDTVE